MRELPIIFSTPMVKAIQEDRKIMTRRIAGLEQMNFNPDLWRFDGFNENEFFEKENTPYFEVLKEDGSYTEMYKAAKVRYSVGDKLWVRETYYATGYWECIGRTKKTGKPKMNFHDTIFEELGETYRYYENPPETISTDREKVNLSGWFKRPAIFMPKAAARIWLEVTGVRCERLQDISQEDCIAEGIEKAGMLHWRNYLNESYITPKPIESFQTLWQSINGKDSWDLNPWVFVYEFKIIKK